MLGRQTLEFARLSPPPYSSPSFAVSFRRSIIATLAMAVVVIVHPHVAAAQTDVIRGRIIGPDSLPVERATITVTSLTGNVTRSARTDKNGRYTVTFPGDEGDYFVNVAALGFAGRRFEIKRTGDQEILIADAKLQRVAEQLDAVKVNADRQRVGRNDVPDISGSERSASTANVSADQLGDLAALAASLPGVQLIPDADGSPNGFSVLGLTADQNATTLNGMNFGGSNLPRDANVSHVARHVAVRRLARQLQRRPAQRSIAPRLELHHSHVEPQRRRAADAVDRSRGAATRPAVHNVSLGGAFSGPIETDKSFFSIAYQAGRRSSDLQSLLNTDALGLRAVGVAADSVRNLLNILGQDHVPSTIGGLPGARLNDQALVFGTFDLAPPSSTTGQAFNITFNGSWNRQDPSGLSSTELPSHGGERENWYGGVQAKHSGYFGFGVLSETPVGVNRLRFDGNPFVDLPNASVRVTSTFDDGTAGVQNLVVRRQPDDERQHDHDDGAGDEHAVVVQREQQASAQAHDRVAARRVRAGSQRPTSSARSASTRWAISPPARRRRSRASSRRVRAATGNTSLGTSLGDSYRPTDDLQVQYGIRLDGNRFGSTPEFNPEVEQAFGLRNDYVPNKIYASPRVGFSWTYGTAPQVAAFDGAARGPRAVIRGGVGLFQNTPNATVDRHGDRQHRAPVGGAAAHVRRHRDADARIGSPTRRVSARSPRNAPTERTGTVVREHRAERRAVRQAVLGAAGAPLEPAVERLDARQRVPRLGRRDVFVQPRPAEHVRSELQSGGAVRAGERGWPAGVRPHVRHRADQR